MDPIGLTNLGPSPGAAPFQATQGLGANPTGGGHPDFVFVILFVSVFVAVTVTVTLHDHGSSPPRSRFYSASLPTNGRLTIHVLST